MEDLHIDSADPDRYLRSLSMEELSSIAREIYSPRGTKTFYQEEVGGQCKLAGNLIGLNLECQERTSRQKTYHSWPKASFKKKRSRKSSGKGNEAILLANVAMIEKTERGKELRRSSSQNRINRKHSDNSESCQFTVSPFYHVQKKDSKLFCKNQQEVKILNNKDMLPNDSGRGATGRCHANSAVFEDASREMEQSSEISSEAKIFHETERKESNLSCTCYDATASYLSFPKEKYGDENEGCHKCTTERMNFQPHAAAFAGSMGPCFNEGYSVPIRRNSTKEKRMGNQRIKVEISRGDGNSWSKSLQSPKYISTLKQNEPSGSHFGSQSTHYFEDESSESSDSGVGNVRYDYLLKNWNEQKVSGPLFKTRSEILKNWFIQFDDEQKNITLKMLLGNSGLAQMHMLSEIMAPILHKDCPPNCQDLLTWLPSTVIQHILKYLDPVSLARASQVNRAWWGYCSDEWLWQRFCIYPDMQLSPVKERAQITKCTKTSGEVQWKKVFIERFCLRRNWLNAKCKIRTFHGHTQGVSCVQFDETRIVSGSSDKTIKVWDISCSRTDPVLTLVGHSGTVRCLHLNGNQLVSGSADATIKVWDLVVGCDWSSAACRVTMVGHSETVRCLQVDENKVVSGSYDKTLKMWDIKTGECRITFRGHWAAVLCVQFDDEKIVSGSADRTIKVWDIKAGNCITTLKGHSDAVTCLQFNVHRIFSGSLDCTLKFWDLRTGQCIGTIDWIRSEGHTRVVRCLQADNWKIVSAGDDKTLKIWSLETGKRFVTLRNHSDGVTCLQFNDHMIVSGSYDKTVKLWDFSPNNEDR